AHAGGRAKCGPRAHRRAPSPLAAARRVAAARRTDRPAGLAGRAALRAGQRTGLVGQPPAAGAGRRAALQSPGRRVSDDAAQHRHDFTCRKDAAMNDSLNSFRALSLPSIAVVSLLLTACSEPPAPAAIVKPV